MFDEQHWTRVDTILEDTAAYTEYLRTHCGLEVTMHWVERFTTIGAHRLVPYNIHRNPMCTLVKSDVSAWEHCIAQQHRVCKKAQDGPFFGMCWAGVSEFIFPVYNSLNQAVAFISVSGYACDQEKALRRFGRVAAAYDLDASQMLHTFQRALRHDVPDLSQVRTVIQPLASQLTLMCHLYERYEMDRHGEDTFCNDIIQFINRHYTRNVSLKELSTHFNCSVSHISHMFRKYHQGTIRDYVNQLRVTSAKQYLINTQMPIQSIAFVLGYLDSNYFSTVFRKYTSLSPREWRDANRQ